MIIQFKKPLDQEILTDILASLKQAHHHGILVENHLVVFDTDTLILLNVKNPLLHGLSPSSQDMS